MIRYSYFVLNMRGSVLGFVRWLRYFVPWPWLWSYGGVFLLEKHEAYDGAVADITPSTCCIRWASAARCG